MTHSEEYKQALLLEQESRWEEAALAYKQMLLVNETVFLIAKCGWCYSRAEQYDLAIEQFDKLITVENDNPKWHYMKGYQFYMQKKYVESIECFDKALALKEDYFVVLYRNAYANLQVAGEFMKLKKAEFWKAIGLLERAHAVWGDFSDDDRKKEKGTYFDINFLHGKALSGISNYNTKAVNCFKDALAIKEDIVCRYNLAKTYYCMGEYDLAWDNLPDSHEYYIKELKAYLLAKRGETESAIKLLESLLRKKEKDYLYVVLATIYLSLNRFNETIDCSKKAIRIKKGNHKAYCLLAKGYYGIGLLCKAIESLELAISIKRERFNADYVECMSLLNEIKAKIDDNYKDDEELIKTLESTTKEFKGRIKKYLSKKAFGFIESREIGDVFFHVSSCKFPVREGMIVAFEYEDSPKGKVAKNIRLIK